ncbi:endonuclease, partial [Vibrio phage D51]
MLQEKYPAYFSPSGQVKRNLSSEDKLFIRQKLLDEEERDILIAEGTGLAKDKHLFDCEVCEYSWEAALRDVCTKNSGCPNCSNQVRRTCEETLAKCAEIAPEGYSNFSCPDYRTTQSKIHYMCDKGHYVTTTTAHSFLQGTRCPECAHQAPDTVYLYELGSTGVYKIGVTTSHLGMRRINTIAKSHNVTPTMILMEKKVSCRNIETTILNEFSSKRAEGMVGDGVTEMFEFSNSDIIRIKEIV